MARPVLPWRSPLFYLPGFDKEVWIRRLPWYDKPQSGYTQGVDGVNIDTTYLQDPPETQTLTIPWTTIHTWKFRYLADEQAAFPPE
jgi:hypothetical protein